MKKMMIACVIALMSLQAFAHSRAQVRLAFDLQSDFNMKEFSFDTIMNDSFADTNWIYWGTMIEVAVGTTGFGITGFVNLPTTANADESASAFSWDGGIFMNHHIFGVGRLLDPYFGIGFNCAGGIVIDRSGIYGEENWGREPYDPVKAGDLRLALYPYLAAGIGLDLNGFLVGTKLSFQPYQIAISGLEPYVSPMYSLDIYGGVALGGHR